jgi:tRNA (guanine26-N2/guanine27-N2)-dimethyltransferase
MLKKIKEGKVEIYYYPGKISKKTKVFYNPDMRFNRDVSVLALQTFQENIKRKLTVMDVLAGTGIRGIRYSKEVKGINKTILNDLNPSAVRLIKKNIELNKVKNVEVYNKDANVLLSEYKYLIDFVDIDPFGSPIQFLDSAARAVSNKGFLGITATDTGPLCGTYPQTCFRRYNSRPLRVDIKKEIGIRILISSTVKECSKYDKGFIPVLSVSKRHYFRIFGRIDKRKSAAEKALENIGYVLYCNKCKFRLFSNEILKKCENCNSKLDYAGPLWIDNIFEESFCKNLYQKGKENEELRKFLEIIKEESKFNSLWYDLHDLSKNTNRNVPKTSDLIKKLRKKGFKASVTHFSGSGVRTNAKIKEIKNLF